MLLTVFERLILLNVLPKEGDFTTLKIVRQLREDLSWTEEEHAALQFHTKCRDCGHRMELTDQACPECGGGQDGQIHWITKAAQDAEIPIGEKATDIIVATLKALDEQKSLRDEHFTLYERFVESK